jgi:general secretion pathway protein C
VRGIVAAHLFGQVVEDPNAQDPAHAPQTTADLSLAGTLATGDPKRGFAIIRESGRATLYKVGDDVADGSLHSVYRDRVLLRRHGRLESLTLPRLRLANDGSGGPASQATQAAAADGEDPPQQHSKFAGDLLQGAQIMAGGKLRGFRIFPSGNPEFFGASGLRNGDLVVAIDGTPLVDTDPQTGQTLFNSMKSVSQATVTIERAGHRRDVTIGAATAPDPSDPAAETDR